MSTRGSRGFRSRIDAGIAAWSLWVVHHPWRVIFVCALFSAFWIAQLPGLRVDNSSEAFLHEDDTERARYDRFKEQFDREDRVLVLLGADDVFAPDFAAWLREVHRAIEAEVPYVEEVLSLVNARNTRGEGDELIVEELMEDWPSSPADFAELRARALANPFYQGNLVTPDSRFTVISIKPFTYSTQHDSDDVLSGFEGADAVGEGASPEYLTDVEGNALCDALYALLDRNGRDDVEVHVIGGPIFDHRMNALLQNDVSVLMSVSLVLEALLLFFLFRRVSGMLLPLLVVVLSMLSTMGFMVWLDIPFSITLNVLPAFLLVVGVCDAVHIQSIAYRRLDQGDAKSEAIVFALRHSGLAVVMTSLTTAAGLASFGLAELAPIAQLGVLAPAGVLLAMFYSLALLPALLSITPLRARTARAGKHQPRPADRFLAGLGTLSTRHPTAVVVATAILLALAWPGFRQVQFSHDGIRWFPEEDPVRVAEETFDAHFQGASSLEVVITTPGENGLYDPDGMARIDRAMRFSESLDVAGRPVGKVLSLVDIVKETHQALNGGDPGFYRLPTERAVIAQEMLLFENSGSDDLEEWTDTRFQQARVTVRTPWVDALEYPSFLEAMHRGWTEILGDDLAYEFTGGAVLFTRVFEGVIYSMSRSYVFALAVITPLMVFLIGNLRRGLVAMIPNLIPVYLVLALMGYWGVPIDAGTLLIGGVIIGLAVDDTIHFMHRFGRYYDETGDASYAVHETLLTTGTALLFTSIVLAMGFSVFLLSYMQNTMWFGGLSLFGTVAAFGADILLAPALMVLVTRAEGKAPLAA
ncbi:MAG: MMPL family transporter [Myxococcota bacterium]